MAYTWIRPPIHHVHPSRNVFGVQGVNLNKNHELNYELQNNFNNRSIFKYKHLQLTI